MLGKQKIISQKDSSAIINGLKNIAGEIETGRFRFAVELEDIHMNIEAAAYKKYWGRRQKTTYSSFKKRPGCP